jgi:hypothetical protein
MDGLALNESASLRIVQLLLRGRRKRARPQRNWSRVTPLFSIWKMSFNNLIWEYTSARCTDWRVGGCYKRSKSIDFGTIPAEAHFLGIPFVGNLVPHRQGDLSAVVLPRRSAGFRGWHAIYDTKPIRVGEPI